MVLDQQLPRKKDKSDRFKSVLNYIRDTQKSCSVRDSYMTVECTCSFQVGYEGRNAEGLVYCMNMGFWKCYWVYGISVHKYWLVLYCWQRTFSDKDSGLYLPFIVEIQAFISICRLHGEFTDSTKTLRYAWYSSFRKVHVYNLPLGGMDTSIMVLNS